MTTKASTSDVKNLINHLDLSVSPFFTRDELDELARDAGFVQRESKLNGGLFLDLVVFNSESVKAQSLNDLSVMLKNDPDADITKQSLHERFNDTAVAFLKEALLCKQRDAETLFPKREGIRRILIKDSVCFQTDESLSLACPGSGGSGSKASARIQFEYGLLAGAINDLSLNAFNNPDAKDAVATVDLISEGDLIIRDLAYVGLEALKGVVKHVAYYLCRLNLNVKVYEKKNGRYETINFKKVRRFMKRHGLTIIEKDVFPGKKEKFKTRLVIHLMPEEEVNKRIRKARQNNKKKGRNELTEEYLVRAHLNLFITNTSVNVAPPCHVWTFYR